MPSSALRDPALGYTERQFHFTIGNAYTHLGMASEAEESQAQALGMYQPGEYLDPALIQLDQAQLMATAGEVDEACRRAVATIEAVPSDHRGLVTHYGRSFAALLPPTAATATPVVELRELVAAPNASS